MADPIEQVHHFIQTLNAASDQVQHGTDSVGQQGDHVDGVEEGFAQHAEDFVKLVQQFTETLTHEHGEMNEEFEQLHQALNEGAHDHLGGHVEYLEHASEEHSQVLSQSDQHLHEQYQHLDDQGFKVVDKTHQEVDHSVGDLDHMVQDTFKTFGEGVHSLESNLHEAKGHSEDHFHDIVEHLSGPISSALKESFEQVTHGFADTITSNFTSHLGELGSGFTNLFNNFGQTAEEVGQDLIKTGEDIFKDMVEHAKEEVTQKIATTVEHAIEQVIAELIEELVEHIAEGTAGAAVTAAIGEFVPLLAICKAILPIIKELLDAMTLGAV